MRKELWRLFDFYDRDGRGDLRMNEVSTILADLGLNPKDHGQQKVIAQILEEVDERGTQPLSFNFEDFCRLVQRVKERMQVFQREREDEFAIVTLGLTPEHLQKYRTAF